MVIGPVAHPPLGKLGAPAERSGALVTALVKLSPKTGSRFTLYETKARIDAPAPLQFIFQRECCVKLRSLKHRGRLRIQTIQQAFRVLFCPHSGCSTPSASERVHAPGISRTKRTTIPTPRPARMTIRLEVETEEEGRTAGVVAAVGRGVQQRALQLDRSWSTSRRSWWRTPKPRQRTRRAPPSKWRGSPSRKSAVGLATSRQDLSPKEIKKVTQRATLA